MGLVAGEVGVGLDGSRHLVELGALLQFHIHHAAVDAFTQGDGHRQGVLHAGLRTYADRVAHRHTRAEVRIAEALGGKALHQRADDGVAARVPTGGNDADGLRLFINRCKGGTVVEDAGVDVERVDGVDAEGQDLPGIFLARTGGRGQDGYIDVLEFADVLNYFVGGQFGGLIVSTVATHDACNFKVRGGLQCLKGILSNVAVTYDGCSDFLHVRIVLLVYF